MLDVFCGLCVVELVGVLLFVGLLLVWPWVCGLFGGFEFVIWV